LKKIILTILFLSIITNTKLNASCGAANCPLNNYRFSIPGGLSLHIYSEYINQNEIFVGADKSYSGAIPEDHDEMRTVNYIQVFGLQYGISDRLALNIDVPYIHREHWHLQHDTGQDVIENWNFNGTGDVRIVGQFNLIEGKEEFKPSITLIGGFKLPTGVTDEKNSYGEEAEVTIQPGTGSLDEIFGINFHKTLASLPLLSGDVYSALPLNAGILYQVMGKGKEDYKMGNSLIMFVSSEYSLSESFSVLIQINGKYAEKANPGSTGEPAENTGGKWLFVSPGISYSITNNFNVYGYIQVPVYQNVNGIQQASKYNLQAGFYADLGLLKL
jgi:hypothetical protein